MPHFMIESQQMPYGQVEIPSGYMHPDMAGDGLHGDSSVRVVFVNARLPLHQHQNNPKVRILDHGLGVASVLPGRLAFQLFNLGVQIEFQKYTGSGLYRSLRSSARCLRLTDFHGLVVSLCFRTAVPLTFTGREKAHFKGCATTLSAGAESPRVQWHLTHARLSALPE